MANNTEIYTVLLKVKQEIGGIQSNQHTIIDRLEKINGNIAVNEEEIGKLKNTHSKQKGIVVAIGAVVTVIGNAAIWFWRSVTNAN